MSENGPFDQKNNIYFRFILQLIFKVVCFSSHERVFDDLKPRTQSKRGILGENGRFRQIYIYIYFGLILKLIFKVYLVMILRSVYTILILKKNLFFKYYKYYKYLLKLLSNALFM